MYTLKLHLYLILLLILSLLSILQADQLTTIYTPEGKSVSDTYIRTEASSGQIATWNSYTNSWIIYNSLNAVRVGSSTLTYNCHGYAWSVSEGGPAVWIGLNTVTAEDAYWTDEDCANHGNPSYSSSSEASGTHVSYEATINHSLRKIQNSYPRAISGSRDYVAKWGKYGLVQHEKGHDIYKYKSTSGFTYRKLTTTTHSGTLSSHPKTWVGAGGITHTVTDNTTVQSNQSLTIRSGATVTVSSGKKIQVNGTLKANGAKFQPTTGSTWYGINFYNCSSSSEITNCEIRGSTYGLFMYYYSNVKLRYNDVSLNTHGMLFSNYSDGNGTVHRNDIHSNEYGVFCVTYSDPCLYQTGFIDNDIAIYGNNSNCNFNLGSNSSEGQNSFLYSSDYDIYSTYPGTIQAQYNYWDSPPDTTNNYGNTNCSNPLTSGPYYLYKKMPKPEYEPQILAESTITDTIGLGEVEKAAQLYRQENYDQAALDFNAIIQKYADHFSGKRALVYLFKSQKMLKTIETTITLQNIAIKYNDKELAPLANHLLACELLTQGEYESAILKLKSILASNNKGELEKDVLYDLGTIYYYHLNDKKQGEIYLRQLIDKYPDDHLAVAALSTLGEWRPGLKKRSLKEQSSTPESFALHQNYPNPFNPTTTINYSLPESGKVTLKIYDIQGREVVTLVNDEKSTGQYSIVWNGNDRTGLRTASGMYFYKLQFKDKVITKKMVLMR